MGLKPPHIRQSRHYWRLLIAEKLQRTEITILSILCQQFFESLLAIFDWLAQLTAQDRRGNLRGAGLG